MQHEMLFAFTEYYHINNLHIIESNSEEMHNDHEVIIYTEGSVMDNGNCSELTVQRNKHFVDDFSTRHNKQNSIY